jgi:DNA-binding transcriptional LysR family regulator
VKIRQVDYFLALCEEQNFTRAAKRCGVAQPSLTRAIQQLEQELGTPLFERTQSIVRLTCAGALLRPDFERIALAVADVARKAAQFGATPQNQSDPDQWRHSCVS